jgi:hypothetical protein
MTRTFAAIVVALHGVIHLIGFVVPWRLATIEGFTATTRALNGSLPVGDIGARLIGLAWLVLAIGFVVAGVAIWRDRSWALSVTAALAAASLVVCVLGLPEAAAGIAIDLAILGAIATIRNSTGTQTARISSPPAR